MDEFEFDIESETRLTEPLSGMEIEPDPSSSIKIKGESSRPGAWHLEIVGNCTGDVFVTVVERFYAQYGPTLVAVDNVARWNYQWKVIIQVNERTFNEFCNRTEPWYLMQSDVGAFRPRGAVEAMAIAVPSGVGVRRIQ